MHFSNVVSVIALVIAIFSLGFTVFFNLRDRASLKTMSTFYPDSEAGTASISVSVINNGRRPTVLRLWGGTGKDGNWAGTFLNDGQSGHRLAEHERLDLSLRAEGLFDITPNDDIEFVDLWVEDTLGACPRIALSIRNPIAILANNPTLL